MADVTTVNPVSVLQDNTAASKAAAAKNPATKDSVTGLADNFSNFLQLFLAQLKNQDPTSPMDTNAMTAQLAQFAGVEQAIKSNTKLDELIQQNNEFEMTSAMGYTGSVVRVESEFLHVKDKAGKFSYTLAEKVDNAQVVIKDSDGTIVRTVDAATTAGEHNYSWDGTNVEGEQLPDGVYSVEVYTSNVGDKVEAKQKTIVSAIVSSVNIDQESKAILLTLSNGDKIPTSKILGVGAKDVGSFLNFS